MRVIAGKAGSLNLKTPRGYNTRPTRDIQKETLFNMLNAYLLDNNFLDLFAGSGAIGIEALSRGAGYAAFVESNRDALQCIKENLFFTNLDKYGEIFAQDVFQAIRTLEIRGKAFDIVFMDPPYDSNIEKEVLLTMENSNILHRDSVIVLETTIDTNFDYLEETDFSIFKRKQYKKNQHVFIDKRHPRRSV